MVQREMYMSSGNCPFQGKECNESCLAWNEKQKCSILDNLQIIAEAAKKSAETQEQPRSESPLLGYDQTHTFVDRPGATAAGVQGADSNPYAATQTDKLTAAEMLSTDPRFAPRQVYARDVLGNSAEDLPSSGGWLDQDVKRCIATWFWVDYCRTIQKLHIPEHELVLARFCIDILPDKITTCMLKEQQAPKMQMLVVGKYLPWIKAVPSLWGAVQNLEEPNARVLLLQLRLTGALQPEFATQIWYQISQCLKEFKHSDYLLPIEQKAITLFCEGKLNTTQLALAFSPEIQEQVQD